MTLDFIPTPQEEPMTYRKGRVLFARAAAGLTLCGALVLAAAAAPQDNLGRGRISGSVLDEKGGALEGAKVVIQSLTAKTRIDTVTDAKGRFAAGGMGSGAWNITATRDGYGSSSLEVTVSQLKQNAPAIINLKKLVGVEAFKADKESAALFDRGNQLYVQGSHDEAIKVFEEFLAKFPEIYQARLNLGYNYLKKGDLDKAQSEFQMVLDKTIETLGSYQKDPNSSFRAFSGLGEIALKKNDFESAQKFFRQSLDISPLDQTAAYNVGEIFFSNQKIDEAITYFEMAIKIKKDWSKPYLRLGMVYLNKGDFPKALENLNKFVEMDPENPEVPNAKGMIAAIDKIKK
jgi:tetratricopeptide (TPR) repeat protein